MRFRSAWCLVAATLVIAGCGGGGSNSGGGGGGGNPAPTVSSVSPANNASGVSTTPSITAAFSEAMSASTISGTTFTLSSAGGAVAGTVSYSAPSNTATFTPNTSLAFSTAYTATITTGVQSSAAVALASNYTWTFTTGAAPAPTVTAVTPLLNATGIAIGTAVTATFSEAMDSSTITGSTFTLTPQVGSAVAGTVTYNSTNQTATLTPSAPLATNTIYTGTITTGVKSSSEVALSANYTWSFTTAAAVLTPPSVTAVTPTSGNTTAAIATTVTATFNGAMDSSTITGSTFTLTGPGNTSVQGTVVYNAGTSVATFTPAANLSYNSLYTATLSASIMSSSGVALAPYTWSFTTTTAPVPTVTTTVPANSATGVNINNALTATFSVPMNSLTITASTFTLATTSGNTPVSGVISYNTGTSTVTFTPNASLAYNTSYTATITTGAQSSNNVALASNYAWIFTTGASPNQVTVDFGTTYQTIRGFGGSTAWLGTMPSAVATALFSPTNGIGLSILRVRIDPNGSSSSNYVTANWGQELTNSQEAIAANSNAVVIASPWTPPSAMKTSNTTYPFNTSCSSSPSSLCGGYLNPSSYAAYAAYLEDFVTYFANSSVNLYAISMQNEPDAQNVGYESCYWSGAAMDTWVASLTSGGATNPITTKLIMPESESFTTSYSDPTLADPNAVGNVAIVAGHIYGVQPSYQTNAEAAHKDVWMTEFGPLSATALTWAQALTTYGESIHNSMVTGQYNAYVWWGVFGASTGSCATNAGTCGLVDNAGTLQPMGEVMGQYSKFIQPGYVRVSATATPVSGVFVSAYMNISPSHYVIVAINSNTSSESLSFVLNNGSSVTSLTPYQSTSSAGLAAQSAVTVSGGQFSYTLPAQSIVTFVQ